MHLVNGRTTERFKIFTTRKRKTPEFWKGMDQHVKFFNWLYNKLGYKNMDDWYNITVEDIHNNGGHSFLGFYCGSPSSALQRVYPEHNWQLWRFKVVPNRYWSDVKKDRFQLKAMLDWLGDQLSVKCLDDWYRVTFKQVRMWIRPNSIKDLGFMLKIAYPNHVWNLELFGKISYSKPSQKLVVNAVQQLFPGHGNSCQCL